MNLRKVKNINITAGGIYGIDVFSANDYVYVSSGGVTLASNLIITQNVPPMGIQNGLELTVFYDGSSITFGSYTCNIFGTLMPSDLRNKKLVITVYCDGSVYKVHFAADYSTLSSLFGNKDMIYNDGTAGTSSTIAAAGSQTLRSFTLPVSMLKAGDTVVIRVSGALNTANSKTLQLIVNDGTNTQVMFTETSIKSDMFVLESSITCTDYNNGYWKANSTCLISGNYPKCYNFAQTTVPALDFTLPWTISVIGTETVLTAGQIQVYQITAEKKQNP